MEQNPFPEERNKKEEGRQAPKPQVEPEGRQQIMMEQNPFPEERKKREGRQAPNQRREKKRDKHRNPTRNQEEPANHDGTEPLS